MREIKFRAWNKEEMVMYDAGGLEMHRGRIEIRLFGRFNRDNFGIVELMQYTGLKDNNGKEIYEGDIICWVDEVAVEEIEGHLRYEPEGKFVEVKIPDFYFFTADTVNSDECEIIGNIYENPDLLK